MSARAVVSDEARSQRDQLGVVLVDTLRVVRAGMRLLIEDRPDLGVVADVGTAQEALALIAASPHPRLVILVGLGLDGPEDAVWLIRAIRERHPTHAVVAVGANAEPGRISQVLFTGADGYVDKNVDPLEFLASLEAAARGETPIVTPESVDPGTIALSLDRRRALQVALSDREREVLEVAAEGLTAR
jgi:DNA-binding NarL/FixJ family response regulator